MDGKAPEIEEIIRRLGERLRQYRERAGPDTVPQTAISAHLKTSGPFWGMVERGTSRPGLENLKSALAFLKATPREAMEARILLAASQVEDDELRIRILDWLDKDGPQSAIAAQERYHRGVQRLKAELAARIKERVPRDVRRKRRRSA